MINMLIISGEWENLTCDKQYITSYKQAPFYMPVTVAVFYSK